jgi:hypothetical protein
LIETQGRQARVYGPDNPKTAKSTYVLAAWINLDGDHDKALAMLQQAVEHGLDASTIQNMENDADFKTLRKEPRFVALVADARHRAESPTKAQ